MRLLLSGFRSAEVLYSLDAETMLLPCSAVRLMRTRYGLKEEICKIDRDMRMILNAGRKCQMNNGLLCTMKQKKTAKESKNSATKVTEW